MIHVGLVYPRLIAFSLFILKVEKAAGTLCQLSARDPRVDVSTRIEIGIAVIFVRVPTLRQAS